MKNKKHIANKKVNMAKTLEADIPANIAAWKNSTFFSYISVSFLIFFLNFRAHFHLVDRWNVFEDKMNFLSVFAQVKAANELKSHNCVKFNFVFSSITTIEVSAFS